MHEQFRVPLELWLCGIIGEAKPLAALDWPLDRNVEGCVVFDRTHAKVVVQPLHQWTHLSSLLLYQWSIVEPGRHSFFRNGYRWQQPQEQNVPQLS